LFSLSCELGARLSGASEVERGALRDYGLALGTAYQIYDDCLDVFGTEARAGKSLRTDLISGKPTLPIIVAWEKATADERRFLEEMVAAWEPGFMKPLIVLLERTGALVESRAVIRGFCATAQAALQRIEHNDGRGRLAAAAQYIGQQTDDLGV
jgi:octaprenyl-diphosphate synthase